MTTRVARDATDGGLLRRFRSPAVVALAPLLAVITLFFLVPIGGMAVIAFNVEEGTRSSHLGFDNWARLSDHGTALWNSGLVSLIGSAIGAGIGAVVSFCIAQIRSRRLDSITAVLSSVLANSGGAPLAFSFIVTIGNAGLLYGPLGLDALGFSLYSWPGLVVMYQYFLIPTLVMVTLPTFVGLRREWLEASTSLGAGEWTYWRRIGLPVAMPALLGGWVLLFGAAFATYASAAILIGSGAFPLVPLAIASELRSGMSSGGEGTAMALGMTMVVVAVLVLLLFNRLQKMSSRWLPQ